MTPSFSVLIADDEPLARANLQALIDQQAGWKCVAATGSGPQTLDALNLHRPDVLFLDIRMPGLDGLQVAERLEQLESPPLVVFVTAFDHHAIRAFELDAVDYLLKPFDDQRFAKTLQRLSQRLGDREPAQESAAPRVVLEDSPHLQRIVIKSLTRIRFVEVRDLIWIAASGNYVQLYLAQTCLLHRATLSSLERELDPRLFLRVQRSAIVHRERIVEVRTSIAGRYQILMQDGSEVEISQRYRRRVLEKLGIA